MATSMTSLLCLLAAVQLSAVFAYPQGAPASACEEMIPSGHAPAVAQTNASLYEIKLSSATYCPKNDVNSKLVHHEHHHHHHHHDYSIKY